MGLIGEKRNQAQHALNGNTDSSASRPTAHSIPRRPATAQEWEENHNALLKRNRNMQKIAESRKVAYEQLEKIAETRQVAHEQLQKEMKGAALRHAQLQKDLQQSTLLQTKM